MRRLIWAALLLVTTACGGGGAVVPAPAAPTVDLGLVSATTATVVQLTVANPSAAPATVIEAGTTGPFRVVPGQLPMQLTPLQSTTIDVALEPLGAGALQGSVGLRITSTEIDTFQGAFYRALAEAVDLTVSPASLDYGEVLPGEFADRVIEVRNDSSVSPAHVTGITAPTADYSVVDPVLPITIAPGNTALLTVRYAPTGPGTPGGNLLLTSDDPAAPHVISLQGATGGQVVIELGSQAFDATGNTDVLSFHVPADAISFMVEGTTASNTEIGLRLLTGPNGEEFENEQLTGPYLWYPLQFGIFTAQVPNTDRSEVQIPPGGGTWALRLYRRSGGAASVDVRVIVERRPTPGTENVATLDLNVFLANAIAPTAATAANDSVLQTVIGQVHTILGQQGIAVGDIDYYDVTDPTYDDVTTAEFGPMLTLSSAASEVRLNLFFVRTALGGGVLGVSPTLGGPQLNGTELSGVMSLYNTNNPNFIGLVAAHEIGHYLGLAHTREANGTFDDILDTAECPGPAPACSTAGGGYLMHWQAIGGTTLTDGQGLVIRGHPHMSPALPPPGALVGAFKPAPAPVAVPEAFKAQPWCGTCQREHKSK